MEQCKLHPFNVIGDIAIVSVPTGSDEYKQEISRSIIARHRNIKTVLNKVARVGGDARTAGFEMLAGDSTVTLHREFGYKYRLDLSRVFFSSHLAYERNRVALQVKPGERVLVPFCGVGPFVIPVASRGAYVLALDGNPEACRWLYENVRLNRVKDRVLIAFADVQHLPTLSVPRFERAILPVPYGQERVLYSILPHIVRGGWIHLYCFKKPHQIGGLIREYRDSGLDVLIYRKCGNVAPGVKRWVFDMKKQE